MSAKGGAPVSRWFGVAVTPWAFTLRGSPGLEGVLSGWLPANSVLRNALCHPKETSSLAEHGNIRKIVHAKEEKLRFCSAGNAAEKRLPLTQKRTRKRQTRVRRLLVFAH